jgi:hypothetical protein
VTQFLAGGKLACLALSAVLGFLLYRQIGFPSDDPILELVRQKRPMVHEGLRLSYTAMLFTTPLLGLSLLRSALFIFVLRPSGESVAAKLPDYPDPSSRRELFVVLGEVHHPKRAEPSEKPQWLTIPSRGLFTGIVVIGAIGSGKTSGCMYPYAEQLLAFRAADPSRRLGALVLEVKGDFCQKLKRLLHQHGRGSDYVELSLDCPYRYNPLHNDLDAYASAYGIASLLNNLFGHSKEPFWQQAYTNMVKFIILLHKIVDDYVTLFDVYECAINPAVLERKIEEGERRFRSGVFYVPVEHFMAHKDLDGTPFELDKSRQKMKASFTPELQRSLGERNVPFEYEEAASLQGIDSVAITKDKREQLEAVKRWYTHDWCRIEPKLRTSIVEGISVFLSLFDDNPAVKRIFCPPKSVYDPELNADHRLGIPLSPFAEQIEKGIVCALNFPVSANPGLARAIGTLMKQDYQRAVISRIARMQMSPDQTWRETLFLCDEYHSFATVGESDPSGDEKFFALSRQAKCIPIVATQSLSSLKSTLPGETWRTLLQTFRTKIFLSLSDDFSARTASELCGREEQLKLHYGISENGQDASVNMLTGQAAANRSTVGTSKGYNLQRDFVFESKTFMELKNAQAIVLAYDGLNPLPPTYCYLKPYYLNPNQTYFEQLAAGKI